LTQRYRESIEDGTLDESPDSLPPSTPSRKKKYREPVQDIDPDMPSLQGSPRKKTRREAVTEDSGLDGEVEGQGDDGDDVPTARPRLTVHDSAIDVREDIPSPPASSRQKRKELTDVSGFDGDHEDGGPLDDYVPARSHKQRKILHDFGAGEEPGQDHSPVRTSLVRRRPDGGDEYIEDWVVDLDFSLYRHKGSDERVAKRQEMISTQHIPDPYIPTVRRVTIDDHDEGFFQLMEDWLVLSQDVEDLVGDVHLAERQGTFQYSHITVDDHAHPCPLPRKMTITHQLGDVESLKKYKITAVSPPIQPNPLKSTSELSQVFDADLTAVTHSADSSTLELWWNEGPSHCTIQLRDLDNICFERGNSCKSEIQILPAAESPKKSRDEIGTAWQAELEAYEQKHKRAISVRGGDPGFEYWLRAGKDDGQDEGQADNSRLGPLHPLCLQKARKTGGLTVRRDGDLAFEFCCPGICNEEANQEEPVPLRRPFRDLIGDYFDDAIESDDESDYIKDFYTLPMAPLQNSDSQGESDDDEARDGKPSKAFTLLSELVKKHLASFEKVNCPEKVDYSEDFVSLEDVKLFEDLSDDDLEEGQEKEMRLRGGALLELHGEMGLDANDIAAVEAFVKKYPRQEVSDDESEGSGQVKGNGQNNINRQVKGSGLRKGNEPRKSSRHDKGKNGHRKVIGQSAGNGQLRGNEQVQGSSTPRKDNKDGEGNGPSNSNGQVKGNKDSEEYRQNNGTGQVDGNGQVKDSGQGNGRVRESQPARACGRLQACEDLNACWCEAMQEIEDSKLW
jgi:hypothetical protein